MLDKHLPTIMPLSLLHATLQAMCKQTVKTMREGQDVAGIAAVYGANERSIYCWLADFANRGQSTLLAKSFPGRPPKVSAEEMQWLAQAIRDHGPHDAVGLHGAKTAVPSLATRRGAVRQRKFETYPAIRSDAREAGAMIYFADKSGIRLDCHTSTMWTPQGCTPMVEVTGKRFSLNMISAVGPQGGFRFMVHDGTVTATVFREFLPPLMIGAQSLSSCLMTVLFTRPDRSRLLYFAAPEPDEQRDLGAREARHFQRLAQTKDEMKRLAIGALRRIQKLPAPVKSFFRQSECQHVTM